ncbi:hypothetical protein HDU83_006091 [Entophlyctis luteolus]|nr:hypothetical protein HDU83_006091 [Entophlyctis luteolus]
MLQRRKSAGAGTRRGRDRASVRGSVHGGDEGARTSADSASISSTTSTTTSTAAAARSPAPPTPTPTPTPTPSSPTPTSTSPTPAQTGRASTPHRSFLLMSRQRSAHAAASRSSAPPVSAPASKDLAELLQLPMKRVSADPPLLPPVTALLLDDESPAAPSILTAASRLSDGGLSSFLSFDSPLATIAATPIDVSIEDTHSIAASAVPLSPEIVTVPGVLAPLPPTIPPVSAKIDKNTSSVVAAVTGADQKPVVKTDTPVSSPETKFETSDALSDDITNISNAITEPNSVTATATTPATPATPTDENPYNKNNKYSASAPLNAHQQRMAELLWADSLVQEMICAGFREGSIEKVMAAFHDHCLLVVVTSAVPQLGLEATRKMFYGWQEIMQWAQDPCETREKFLVTSRTHESLYDKICCAFPIHAIDNNTEFD